MTVSLNRQIQCVEREIAMRKSVYSRQVASGKMRQSVADLEIGDMQAVLETLRTKAGLLAALRRLLKCPDLNLDEVEGETGEAIEQATAAVARADGDLRND